MEVELPGQFLLDPGTDAVAEQGPVGDEHRRLAGPRGSAELPHDELQEEQGRLGRLLVFGEVAEDALLLLAAEGRVGQDQVHPVTAPDFRDLLGKAVPLVICGDSRPLSSRFSLNKHERQGLGVPAVDALGL